MSDSLGFIIGKRIIEARQRKDWSQIELSRACGIDQRTLSKYERGKFASVGSVSLLKIADALGVSVDYLLGRAES